MIFPFFLLALTINLVDLHDDLSPFNAGDWKRFREGVKTDLWCFCFYLILMFWTVYESITKPYYREQNLSYDSKQVSVFKSSSKRIKCMKYFCCLSFWKKVALEPESIVFVLKTSCCSPDKICSSLALQRPVSLYFSVASAYLAVSYFRGQGVFWTVTEFSPVFP